MWQINEVVLFDNDPYRILAIEDGQVVWMQISADKGVPQAQLSHRSPGPAFVLIAGSGARPQLGLDVKL